MHTSLPILKIQALKVAPSVVRLAFTILTCMLISQQHNLCHTSSSHTEQSPLEDQDLSSNRFTRHTKNFTEPIYKN